MKKLAILPFLFLFAIVFGQRTHTVTAKENPYSIAKKYGLTTDELLKLNPKFKDGKLDIGDVLVVNKKTTIVATSATKPVTATTAVQKTGKIYLQPKQTIYSITKQYRISEAELRKLNPELDQNLKIGDAVILPEANIKKYADANAMTTTAIAGTSSINDRTNTDSADNTYTVQPKDTYYAITRKFNISKENLMALNPSLAEKGLQPGEVLVVKGNVPATKVNQEIAKPAETPASEPKSTYSSNDEFVTHTVLSGETLFSISNKYNVSFEQLLELNPSIANGLKEGMVLKIKKISGQFTKKSGDALSVVLMLPFGIEANEAKYRTMSSDFLSGAKLAIERNAGNGQKLDIKIIDAGSESTFKNSLIQLNRNNTDLIIGPFFKSNVLEVLKYVSNEKIPVVAPFANTKDLYDYDNLIIIETEKNTYGERIVKEAKQVYSNQKIFVLAEKNDETAENLKKSLQKELSNAEVFVVESADKIQLDQNMMTGQSAPIIAILASDNENLGVGFTNRVSQLAKEVSGVKAFSLFYHPVFDKNEASLGQANLVYLIDRKINTDGDFEKEILKNYRDKYCKSPSKYAVIGFDVVNDMLTRENQKGEIFKQINKVQTQLATKFEFVRTKKNGAYINTGYRVVRLVP